MNKRARDQYRQLCEVQRSTRTGGGGTDSEGGTLYRQASSFLLIHFSIELLVPSRAGPRRSRRRQVVRVWVSIEEAFMSVGVSKQFGGVTGGSRELEVQSPQAVVSRRRRVVKVRVESASTSKRSGDRSLGKLYDEGRSMKNTPSWRLTCRPLPWLALFPPTLPDTQFGTQRSVGVLLAQGPSLSEHLGSDE
ncbi:hypothetical protein K438DRAFT_1758294 [Mycena galopus ATCC 62051]|nr:hypothetical protein K438DRAFT_1758294 [Mycena galopus ATCC 62051]